MDITDITAGSLIILIFSFALFILMVLYISGYFDDEEEDIFPKYEPYGNPWVSPANRGIREAMEASRYTKSDEYLEALRDIEIEKSEKKRNKLKKKSIKTKKKKKTIKKKKKKTIKKKKKK